MSICLPEKPIIKNRRIWRGSSLKSGEIESPCRGCRQLYQWPFGEIQRAGNPTNATHMWDLLSLYSKSPIFGWFPSLFKSNLPPNFPNFHFKSLFLSIKWNSLFLRQLWYELLTHVLCPLNTLIDFVFCPFYWYCLAFERLAFAIPLDCPLENILQMS